MSTFRIDTLSSAQQSAIRNKALSNSGSELNADSDKNTTSFELGKLTTGERLSQECTQLERLIGIDSNTRDTSNASQLEYDSGSVLARLNESLGTSGKFVAQSDVPELKVDFNDRAEDAATMGDSEVTNPGEASTTQKPGNRNLQVNQEGFIINDERITQNRQTVIERAPFDNPIASIDTVVLHRTVTDNTEATLNAFNSGNHYGTHFVVGRDGEILQTASLNNRTVHAGNENDNSIGIEVVGMPLDANGQQTLGPPTGNKVASWEALTPEQSASVAYITNTLTHRYGLTAQQVKPHEEVAAKTPGEGQTVLDAIAPQLDP